MSGGNTPVYYLAFVDEAAREPRLIFCFGGLGDLPGGHELARRHRESMVGPVSRDRHAMERFFTTWTPIFQGVVDELPPDIGITVVECAGESQWKVDRTTWEAHMLRIGLPQPVWLYDDHPDFSRLVDIGRTFPEEDTGTPVWQSVLGTITEDVLTSVARRIIPGLG